MEDFLQEALEWSWQFTGPALEFFFKILMLLVTTGAASGVLIVLAYGAWLMISAGLKREERAHCFIRLLDIGLKQGRTIEETIASIARARVRDMGVFFHLVAAWMDRGLRLGAALEEVPRFLPPQVAAMLQVGESIGNVARVLPVCRASLGSGPSDARKQLNNLMVLLFVSPIGPAVVWIISVFVFPKFKAIADDMGLVEPEFLDTYMNASLQIAIVAIIIWLLVWLVETGRGGGNWLVRTLIPPSGGLLDWLNLRIPWKRKRLQRDFSAMLSSLLDAGLSEEPAIRLAAEATANSRFQKRAESAITLLRQGVTLADALHQLDGTGEFQWRLRNACRSGQRFSVALNGWNESLDARAFQQEQFYSQLITTSFVMLNGLMVGLAAVGVFRFLTGIIDSAAW